LVFVILGFRYSWFSLDSWDKYDSFAVHGVGPVQRKRLQPLPFHLPIPPCPVVGFAEHLAIFEGCCAAFAPGGYVVGIHIG
jgi:hypothetical protein